MQEEVGGGMRYLLQREYAQSLGFMVGSRALPVVMTEGHGTSMSGGITVLQLAHWASIEIFGLRFGGGRSKYGRSRAFFLPVHILK